MNRRHLVGMVAVVALLAGSAAFAGEDVDLTKRTAVKKSTPQAQPVVGPTGFDVSFIERSTKPVPPPLMHRKPNAVRLRADKNRNQPPPVPVCSNDPLLGMLSNLFGYGDLAMDCRR